MILIFVIRLNLGNPREVNAGRRCSQPIVPTEKEIGTRKCWSQKRCGRSGIGHSEVRSR